MALRGVSGRCFYFISLAVVSLFLFVSSAAANPAIPPFLSTTQLESSWIDFKEEAGIPYIRLNVPADITYKVSYMTGPDRMVIDLAGTRLPAGGQVIPVESGTIERIRTAQFDPSTVRLVTDLKKPVRFVVEREPDGKHIGIGLVQSFLTVDAAPDDGSLAPSLGACAVLRVRTGAQIRYNYSYLKFPERFVLDLQAATPPPEWPSVSPIGPILGVRFGKTSADELRIVLDLAAQLSVAVLPGRDEKEVLVYLYPQIKSVTYGDGSGGSWINFTLTYPAAELVPEITGPIKGSNGLIEEVLGLNGVVCDKPPALPGKGFGPLVTAMKFDQSGTRTLVRLESSSSLTARAEVSPDKTQVKIYLLRSTLAGRRIVLDPGHGGGDPGAIGPNGIMEKDVVLDIAVKLAGILKSEGAVVYLTRETDIFVPLNDRAAYAASDNPEVFLSIHVNSAATSKASGTETWYSTTSDPKSEILAKLIQNCSTAATKLTDRGLRISDLLVVTKKRAIPAVLHEVAFISNPVEETVLNADEFRSAVARALRDGLEQYFKGMY